MTDLTYVFYSYSRRGAASRILDPGLPAAGRADASLELTIQRIGAAPQPAKAPPLPILGPADVQGLDPVQVVRRSPIADDSNAEPNYLAAIEFRHPDLPWLFSPRGPGGPVDGTTGRGSQIAPWIALIVVREDDPRQPRVFSVPGSPSPVVDATVDELPDLADSWAWAHVQVVAHGGDPDVLLGDHAAYGGAVRSRLLCPRHLDAGASYVACVVPTYRGGSIVGLGGRVEAGQVGLPAWPTDKPVVRLPVYDHWRFRTGPSGDFESLARKIRPLPLGEFGTLGQRVVLIDPVLSRIDPDPAHFATFTAGIRTAVTVPGPAGQQGQAPGPLAPTSAAPRPARDAIVGRLTGILDRPEDLRATGDDRPTVGPPIYGQWHAGVRTVVDRPKPKNGSPAAGPVPGWIPELNLDPEARSAAGSATSVIQQDQEELMASAWDQLEAVVRANRTARWGQLFQTASGAMHRRRIEPRSAPSALRLASPALARLRETAGSDPARPLAARVAQSPAPVALFGPGFARTSRFAARFAGRAPVGAVLDSVGPGLLDGGRVLRTRFDPALDRLKPAEFGALLKAAGLEERVTVMTGHSIDDHVDRLTRLPELIQTTAAALVIDPHEVEQIVGGGAGQVVGLEGDQAQVFDPSQHVVAAGVEQAIDQAQVFDPSQHVVAAGVEQVVDQAQAQHLIVPEQVGQVQVVEAQNLAGGGMAHLVLAGGIHQQLAQAQLHSAAVAQMPGLQAIHGFAAAPVPTGAAFDAAAPLAAAPSTAAAFAAGPLAAPPLAESAPALAAAVQVQLQGEDHQAFIAVAKEAQRKIELGELTASPSVVAELQQIVAQPAGAPEAKVSLETFHHVAALSATGTLDSSFELKLDRAGATHLVVASERFSAAKELAMAGGLDLAASTTAIHAASVESAMLQINFGIDQPFVPHQLVGLSQERLGLVTAQAGDLTAQISLSAAVRTPPEVEPLSGADAHAAVVARLEPVENYTRMLSWLIRIDDDTRAWRRSPSDSVMAAPHFPDPFIDRLRRLDQEWILGGASTIPPNSMVLMTANRRFVEAALVGANHEMARELLWRGYPTDQRGTSFARFWPTCPAGPDVGPADDIAPVPDWTKALGLNPPGAAAAPETTILVVKGELMRRYPQTIVNAIPGKTTTGPGDPQFVASLTREAVPELFRFPLAPDITCVGLAISPDELRNELADGEEWFIALTQPVEEPRFGLDITTETDGNAPDEDDLSWETFKDVVVHDHLGFGAPVAGRADWKRDAADGAFVADLLFQLPFQLLLRAKEYLP